MSKEIKLRPYQRQAVDSIYDYFRSGKKGNPLIVAPTGSGKSILIAKFIQEAMQSWPNTRILMLAHRKELLQQNFQKLIQLWPEAPAGVYSAGLNSRQIRNITIAGIASIYKKHEALNWQDLILVDEAHLIPSGADGEGMYRTLIDNLLKTNSKLKVIGFTATPFRMKTGMLTEPGGIFTDIAYDIEVGYLVKEKFLSPLISKIPRTQADLTNVKIRGGEFVAADAEAAMDDEALTQAAIDEMEAYCSDRKSWIVFCAGVAHAEHVARALNERGHPAEVVVGDTDDMFRASALARFKAGKLKCLVNCDVLCLDSETEILTTEGWVGIDDMTLEHEVANYEIGGRIFFEPPKLVVRRDRKPSERMVSIDQKGINARVTSNHRMLFKTAPSQEFSIQPAEDIADRKGLVPISGYAAPLDFVPEQPVVAGVTPLRIRANSYHLRKLGMDPRDARAEAIRRIEDRNGLLRYKLPSELSIDECLFIGFWIGDGTMTPKQGGGVECSVTQSHEYPAMTAWFDDLISRIGLRVDRDEREKFVRWNFSRGTGFGPQSTSGGYFSIEPYLKKTTNKLLWALNQEQFDALIEGLWRADGAHGDGTAKPRAMRMIGPDRELFSFLQGVAVTKGYRASLVSVPPRKSNHHMLYYLSLTKERTFAHISKPGTFQFEPDSIEERVWCVTSTTGNIITRRRGKVIVTGNTTGFDAPNIDALMLLRPTKSTGLYIQICGRGMRLSPETQKSNCIVLDFAGNIERHGPIDCIKIQKKSKGDGKEVSVAPVKACPECQTAIPISVMRCPTCGYEFPAKPTHDTQATTKTIMVTVEPPKRWTVNEVRYERHEKEGKAPSLKVTYLCTDGPISAGNLARPFRFSEWICVEHRGYAYQKAVAWWLQTHKDHKTPAAIKVPTTVDEALRQTRYLRAAVEIMVQKDGKFDRVVSRVLGEYAGEIDQDLPWNAPSQTYLNTNAQPSVTEEPALPASWETDDVPF